MLLIKTIVKPSTIHGLGLFAAEDIAKGTKIWKFTPGFDQKFTRQQILNFPPPIQIYLCKYAWKSKISKLYCLATDNGKYFNHADNPNAHSEYQVGEEEVITTVTKNVASGEELTDNYALFEQDNDADNILYILKNKLLL